MNDAMEQMLDYHNQRMDEISDMEISTITTLAARHIESIYDSAQVNLRKRERVSKAIEGLLYATIPKTVSSGTRE